MTPYMDLSRLKSASSAWLRALLQQTWSAYKKSNDVEYRTMLFAFMAKVNNILKQRDEE